MPLRRTSTPPPGAALARLAALAFLAVVALVLPTSALADGTPNIALSVDAQESVLFGASSSVALTTTSPVGQPTGRNLSYRVVLPDGLSYVSASAGASAGEPDALTGQPAAGQTTLLWRNVSDLPGGSSHTLAFRIAHTPGSFSIGQSFGVNAGAYVTSSPGALPQFTAAGLPVGPVPGPSSYTGSSDNKTDATVIAALQVDATSTQTPEGELLRGVHQNQSLTTLLVRNNTVAQATGVVVDDYIPAGLEFLGCGGPSSDQTTDAPTNPGSTEEYPGSGAIAVNAVPGCIAPTLVQTVSTDPPGPAPAGIYTHVEWSGLASLPAGASLSLAYRVAIPLRSNLLAWSGSTPDQIGGQTANLDNNAGDEIADETPLTTYARASGLYNNSVATNADASLTRTAEDLSLQKTAGAATLAHGTTTTWDLTLRASEYRTAEGLTLTDTLPDGLCPIQTDQNLTNLPHDASDLADCDPGAPDPSSPFTTAAEKSDGTWLLTWDDSTDPGLTRIAPGATHHVTFASRTRGSYQQADHDEAPILAGDTVTNRVHVAGTSSVACAGSGSGAVACPTPGSEIAHDGPLAAPIDDDSTAELAAASPTISKRIAAPAPGPGPLDCDALTYPAGGPAPAYHPGDRVCFQLRALFPADLGTRNEAITDSLPSTLAFDDTFGTLGDFRTSADTIPGTTFDSSGATPGPGGTLRWTLPGGGVSGENTFEHEVATKVTLPPLPAPAAPGDRSSNVLKAAAVSSTGTTEALRDEATFALSMPVMSVQNRITEIDGVPINAPNGLALRQVRGGQTLTFRVRITNAGDAAAKAPEVWSVLPVGIDCSQISPLDISDSGVCDAGTIKWGTAPSAPNQEVPALANKSFTYKLLVPTTIEPTQALVGRAGVRSFMGETNTPAPFTFIPDDNVDPSLDPQANVLAPVSSPTMIGVQPTVSIARTSSVTESDGATPYNTNATATIGETVRYEVSTVVPAGTTLRDFDITDVIDSRHGYVAGSLVDTGEPGSTVSIAGTTVTQSLGSSYTSPIGADTTFSFRFDTLVTDAPANHRTGPDLSNTATVRYTPPGSASGAPRNAIDSLASTTGLVEPALTVDQSASVGAAAVTGGQTVGYTLTVQVGTGTASPAHETVLVDRVPTGLTPLDATGSAIVDGGATTDGGPGTNGGTWNATARTLTFIAVPTLFPGTSASFTYSAKVNDPAIGGSSLTSSVTASTSSMPGVSVGERTSYDVTDTTVLNVQSASVAITDPAMGAPSTHLTPGEQTGYTVDVTIPAGTIHFDALVVGALPDSLDFDGYVAESCLSGCDPGPTTPTFHEYTPVANGDGTTTVAWDLGDLATSAPATRVLRLTYRAHLRTTHRSGGASVASGQSAATTMRVRSDRTDLQTTPFSASAIPGGPFDDSSPIITNTVPVVEPGATLAQTLAIGAGSYGAAPVTVHDGDVLHYRLLVTNPGNAPLHDVKVTAAPSAELAAITPAAGVSTTALTAAWAAPGDPLEWLIPGPIAAGGTVQLDYTATPRAVALTTDGESYVTTSSVASAFGLPSATRTANPTFLYRSYSTATGSTTATLDSPDLTLVKTTGEAPSGPYPDTAPVQVGQSFGWRVTVTNTSSDTATAFTVNDTLPPNWTYVPASADFSPGGAAEPTITSHVAGDDLTWATGLTLGPGASRVLTYSARPTVAAATTPGTGAAHPHTNTATATVANSAGHAADAAGAFAAAPDTATAILAVPTLTVVATPDGGAASAGSTVAFHVVVKNTGAADATNVLVNDTFPAGTTYTAGAATASPSAGFTETMNSGAAATWKIGMLAAGQSVDITVPLGTDPAASGGTLLTNTAGALADQIAGSVGDTATVTLTPSADLAAAAAGTPNPATAGQGLSYAISATNTGPSVAQDVSLQATLPSTVVFVSAAGCTYAAGPRTVTCASPGATAVGGIRSATIVTTVVPGTTTDANLPVVASSATADPAAANSSVTALVPVGARADLSLVKTSSAATVAHDGTVDFTLAIHNAGPSDAAGVQVVDTLPAGLTYVSDDGGCTAAGQVITCLVGSFLKASSGAIHVVARGTAVAPGSVTNSATISATTAEPAGGAGNETGTAAVTVVPAADLALTKTGPPTVPAGGDLTYVLTATNHGPDDATAVVLTDTLPAGTSFVSGPAGCSAAGQVVSCTVGALANGATATRALVVRALITAGATAITNTASVAGGQADPNPANDAASASTQVGPAADVSIAATAPTTATAGATTTFTLVAHNDGPSDATGVVVTAQLPPGATLVDATTALGSCSPSGGQIVCGLGTLGSGGSSVITITVNVPGGGAGGALELGATIAANEPDPVAGNAARTASVAVVAPEPAPGPGAGGTPDPGAGTDPVTAGTASVSLTKVADGVARAGERLTYTITATNRGPSAAKDVVITDALVAGVTFLSAKSSGVDCTFRDGAIRCPVGTMANGDSVRITVAVTPKKAGMVVNNAFLASSTPDLTLADNRAVASGTVPTAKPTKLRLDTSAPRGRLRGGQVLTYTLRVRNTGKVTAVNVDTCDVLPSQLSFASTSGGTLVESRLCFHKASLAPGRSRVYKVKVRVLPRAPKGSVTNRATAVADNAKRTTDSARSQIVTDGKVAAEQVHGFTG